VETFKTEYVKAAVQKTCNAFSGQTYSYKRQADAPEDDSSDDEAPSDQNDEDDAGQHDDPSTFLGSAVAEDDPQEDPIEATRKYLTSLGPVHLDPPEDPIPQGLCPVHPDDAEEGSRCLCHPDPTHENTCAYLDNLDPKQRNGISYSNAVCHPTTCHVPATHKDGTRGDVHLFTLNVPFAEASASAIAAFEAHVADGLPDYAKLQVISVKPSDDGEATVIEAQIVDDDSGEPIPASSSTEHVKGVDETSVTDADGTTGSASYAGSVDGSQHEAAELEDEDE